MKYRGQPAGSYIYTVAPFAGARIEMLEESLCSESELSLPSRERGLKYAMHIQMIQMQQVAPFAGARIEICECTDKTNSE